MLKNMKIKAKLILAFVIVIILSVILGVVGIVIANMLSEKAGDMFDHVEGINALATAETDWGHVRIYANRVIVGALCFDKNAIDEASNEVYKIKAELDSSLEKASETFITDKIKASYSDLKTMETDYFKLFDAYCATLKGIALEGNEQAMTEELNKFTPHSIALEEQLDEVLQAKVEVTEAANKETDRLSELATIVSLVVMVFVAIISFVLAIYISSDVEKSLNAIIAKLNASTGIISSSATQLNEASESLAMGSSRQAAAIEETSATMNETASMVAQNAENTRVAAQIAGDATNMANKGMSEMQEMMKAMEEIKDSSDKVGKIVKTIDNIAFQTNLLAINATVEAARAGGDAGRSFGVVAEEVRNLAQRSAAAAADTTAIIEKNINLTNTGHEVSRGVASALEEITDKSGQLNKLIAEINAASEEQASGIKQINIAISQMEKVTQENAAVAQENAASSNSMKDEIVNLEDAVSIAKALVTVSDEMRANDNNRRSASVVKKPSSSVSSSSSSFNSGSSANYSSANSTPISKPVSTPKPSSSSSSASSSYKPASSSSHSNITAKPSANNISESKPAPVKSSRLSENQSASRKAHTEAAKIIPLDDDDDF